VKLYKVKVRDVDPRRQTMWDAYAQKGGIGEKPETRGPSPRVMVTSARPVTGTYRRWRAR
jgi:hypothetical protein